MCESGTESLTKLDYSRHCGKTEKNWEGKKRWGEGGRGNHFGQSSQMWERCPVTELNDAGFCSSFNLACVRSPTSWSEIQIQHDGLHVSPGRATFLLSLSVSASRFFFFLLFPIPAFHSLFMSPGLSLFQMKPNVNLIRKKPNIYAGGDLKRGLIMEFQRFYS